MFLVGFTGKASVQNFGEEGGGQLFYSYASGSDGEIKLIQRIWQPVLVSCDLFFLCKQNSLIKTFHLSNLIKVYLHMICFIIPPQQTLNQILNSDVASSNSKWQAE